MIKGTYIQTKKELTKTKKITEYIKPLTVCIPLENKFGVKYKHLVKEGDYVYKGTVVAINPDIDFPIHSSVSGYVIQGTKKMMLNGQKIKCIVIENDFKEKYEYKKGYKKNINNYSKEEFIEMLRTSGITGLGGGDFPTFIKYSSNKSIKCLVINGVECEAYATCDQAIMKQHADELLEAIDAITEIMKIKEAYIILKENNSSVLNEFSKYIGTYPNIGIKLVPDTYPSGWDRSIIENVFNIKYNKYPSEVGIIVNNVSTIYAIYEMLKYNRPLTERIITITGNCIKKPTNIRVKIGAAIWEVIGNIDGYKNMKNPLFIAGGPMMGKSLPSDDVVVTKDLNCIVILENAKQNSSICINCGKCAEVCPVNLIPVLIKDNANNPRKLKELQPHKCIGCGLCSYICPSRIDIREIVKLQGQGEKND
ncbi:MAG: RnfABCDGE type electron transport complex subunit C [bacterium]|nr:RnfABCDGE type electron transport complex subunit C [bacterium]